MSESAQLHSDLEALVGAVLHDRYHVESLLGSGGMGAVFKARHTGLERDVAIKVLHPEIGRDASVSKRFDREATSASRLDHPNCVRVTDFGTTEGGTKYLVMELLEGSELEARLGRPWPPAAMIETAKQILYGLEHAHHFGIIHRDLKPENVFVTKDFRGDEVVKLVDFGIAKLLDERGSEKLTRQGIVFGTPRYMAPEQAAGGKIDERSDLYAAGLIFYEMLAGRPPFETDEPAQLLRMQIMTPPPPLPEIVPASLAKIVEKLLEKSKADRYPSARAVIDALEAVAASLVVEPSARAGFQAGPEAGAVGGVVVVAPTLGLPSVGSSEDRTAPARSGAAWQPAADPAAARSGVTVVSPAQSSAGLATGSHASLAAGSATTASVFTQRTHGASPTGAHAGVGQPATGPFESLAGVSTPAASQASWVGAGAHPTNSGVQPQGHSPHVVSYADMSTSAAAVAVAPGEDSRRRAWVPAVIGGGVLVLVLALVGVVVMTQTQGGEPQAEGAKAPAEQDSAVGLEAPGSPAPADEPVADEGSSTNDEPAPGPTRARPISGDDAVPSKQEDAEDAGGGGGPTPTQDEETREDQANDGGSDDTDKDDKTSKPDTVVPDSPDPSDSTTVDDERESSDRREKAAEEAAKERERAREEQATTDEEDKKSKDKKGKDKKGKDKKDKDKKDKHG